MFSSDALIQIVFAGNNDKYYSEGLMKFDLDQYLWYKLHEKYKAVYFVNTANEDVRVKSYGDVNSEQYSAEQKTSFLGLRSKDHVEKFGKWMCSVLCSKNESAFVFDMQDFCTTFEKDAWKKLLVRIKQLDKRRGTIILVARPFVESSKSYLLDSSVFEVLGTHTVMQLRNSEAANIYSYLKTGMGEGCVYLNTYSENVIHEMLVHVIVDSMKAFPGEKKLKVMSEYISRYLNCRRLQLADSIFSDSFDIVNLKNRDLHDQLANQRTWDRLDAKADEIIEAGGVKVYMSQKGITSQDEYRFPRLSYERSTCEWKCMSIKPMDDSVAEDVLPAILHIHREFSMTRNSPENREVIKIAGRYVDRLNNIRNSTNDTATFKRILYSLFICTQWLYADKKMSEKIKSIEKLLNEYIDVSEQVFQLERSLSSSEGLVFSKAADAITEKYRQEKKTFEIYLEKMDAVIPKYITKTIAFSSVDVSNLNETLESFLSDITEAAENTEKSVQTEQTVPQTEELVFEEPQQEQFDFEEALSSETVSDEPVYEQPKEQQRQTLELHNPAPEPVQKSASADKENQPAIDEDAYFNTLNLSAHINIKPPKR